MTTFRVPSVEIRMSLLSLGLLAITAPAQAATYYVATNGSDANPGTQSAPFRTIQKAADTVGPGDTVMVMPGTYPQGVKSVKSGTANARIRFLSQSTWGAKIRTKDVLYIWVNEGDYVDIEGFDISGEASEAILNYASHVRVLGNHVHDLGDAECRIDVGAGIDHAGSGATDPRTAADNDTIGNVVHDIAFRCPILSGQPGAHGIYHAYGSGIMANNIVYRSQAYGLHLWHTPRDVRVLNNLSFNNRHAGIVIGGQDEVADNIYVANNIFYENQYYGARVFGKVGSNIRFENNVLFLNTPAPFDLRYATEQGTLTVDPQFVNYQSDGSGDYHLRPGSPAIDAGVSLADVPTDFDGVSRPQGSGYDIGAYEFKIGSTLRGDLNGDGKRDLADVRLLIYMLIGQQAKTPEADLTGDGAVTLADVQALIRLMVGVPS